MPYIFFLLSKSTLFLVALSQAEVDETAKSKFSLLIPLVRSLESKSLIFLSNRL